MNSAGDFLSDAGNFSSLAFNPLFVYFNCRNRMMRYEPSN